MTEDAALAGVLRWFQLQSGVMHVRQALAAGFRRPRIDRRCRRGDWVEGPPFVYTVAGPPGGDEQQWWRWYLAVRYGRRAFVDRPVALTRRTAAAALGWELPPGSSPVPTELIVRRGVRVPESSEALISTTRDWADRRFVRVGGWLVCSPIDTCVDLAAVLPRDDLFMLIQAELFRRPAGEARLLERCGPGVEGAANVRSIVKALRRGIDSPMHEQGHELMRSAGMPPPECGIVVVPGTGAIDCFLRRPMATKPPFGAVIQWDGRTHLLKEAKRRHDRNRDIAARQRGMYMKHVDRYEYQAPATLIPHLADLWDHVMRGVWPPPDGW